MRSLTLQKQLRANMAQASYNHGQKSWNKFAVLALLRTGQTKIQPLLPNFASIQCWQLLPWISSEFLLLMTSEYILFIRWGGGTVTRFLLKRKQRFFQTSLVKLRKCPKDLCSRLYMRTGLMRETSSRCTFLFPSHSLLLVSCFLFCAGRLWSLINPLMLKVSEKTTRLILNQASWSVPVCIAWSHW